MKKNTKKQPKARAKAKPKIILDDLEQSEAMEPLRVESPSAQDVTLPQVIPVKPVNETVVKQAALNNAILKMLQPREVVHIPVMQIIQTPATGRVAFPDTPNDLKHAPHNTHHDEDTLLAFSQRHGSKSDIDVIEQADEKHDDSRIEEEDDHDEIAEQDHSSHLQGFIVNQEILERRSCLQQLASTGRTSSLLFRRVSRSLQTQFRKSPIQLQPIFTFVLLAVAVGIFLYLVVGSTEITSPDSYDPMKKWVANNFVAGALIFAFYGIIFLHVPVGWLYVALFALQGAPASFVLLAYLYNAYVSGTGSLPEPDYLVAAYVAGLYYFWLVVALIRNDMITTFGAKRMQLMVTTICTLGPATILGYTVYMASITNQITNEWVHDVLLTVSGPYVATICVMWVYFHFKFFAIANYMALLSSAVLGGTMIATTCISLLLLANLFAERVNHDYSLQPNQDASDTTFYASTDDTIRIDNGGSFYMLLFFAVLAPLFTLTLTALVMNNVDRKLKIILTPILGALIPVFFTLPFTVMFDLTGTTPLLLPLREFFVFGPAATSILIITLLFVQTFTDRLKSISIGSCLCLTLLVPILYLGQLQGTHTFQSEEQDTLASQLSVALLVIGLLVLVAVAVKDGVAIFVSWWRNRSRKAAAAQRTNPQQEHVTISIEQHVDENGSESQIEHIEIIELAQENRFDLTDIFKYDLEDFGIWGNSFGYIVTLTVLAFTFYRRPAWITVQQSGALIGMQVVIIALFIYCLVALRMRIISQQPKKAESLLEKVALLIEEKMIRKDLLDRQTKVVRLIAHLGFIDVPLLMILLIIIFNGDEGKQFNFFTILLGVAIVSAVYVLFHYIKGNFEEQARTAIPVLVVFCWVFLFLPFGGIIPSAIFYLSIDREEYVDWERLVTGSIVVLMLLAIALVMVIVHLFFKRKDFDKKFTFIASKCIKELARIHVKADYYVMGLVYQLYQQDEEKCKTQLLEGEPVYWKKVPGYEPDPRFDKIMVNQRAINLLKQRPERPTKCRRCVRSFIDLAALVCCCYRPGTKVSKEPTELDDLADQEEHGADWDFDAQLDRIIIEARKAEVERQEEEEFVPVEEVEEQPPWIKGYIERLKFRPLPFDVLEAVRRYDLPQCLQISTPYQDKFWQNLFFYFANGPLGPNRGKRWLDYASFKEVVRLSGLTDSEYDQDGDVHEHTIDMTYAVCSELNKNPGMRMLAQQDFNDLFTHLGQVVWPLEGKEEAVGLLLKRWLLPLLVWNVPCFRYVYMHEWEYILFLLGDYNLQDEIRWAIDLEEASKRELEEQLGIQPLASQKLNPDYDIRYDGEPPFTLYQLKESLLLWWNDFLENLAYVCGRVCEPDWQHVVPQKGSKKRGVYDPDEYAEDGYQRKENYKDEIELEKEEVQDKYFRLQANIDINKQHKHEDSPDWPQIVKSTLDEIKRQEAEFLKNKARQTVVKSVRRNFTNCFFLLFKIAEVYAMATMALRPEQDWGLQRDFQYFLGFINTEGPIKNSFLAIYYLCVIGCLLFLVVLYQGVVRSKTNHYGFSEGGIRARRFTWDFVSVQYLLFVALPGSFVLFKCMLDTFSCDYAIVPKQMYQYDDVVCLSQAHQNFMVLAAIILVLTYPSLTFLYPNTQINIRSLDFRYDPTYLVVQVQFKLLVAGLAAFFVRDSVITVQFVGIAVLMILLASLVNKTQPCYYERFNSIEMGMYLLVAWFHISAAIAHYTEQSLYGWYALIAGSAVVLFITVTFYFQATQMEAYKDELEKREAKDMADADASDDKKEMIEFVFWKGLCDLEEKYNTWLPEEMAAREQEKEARRVAQQLELQALNLKEEF